MINFKEFEEAGRALFEEGIIHSTSGNFSRRDGDVFYITAHDCLLGNIRPENIIRVNVSNKKLDRGTSVEVDVHRSIYNATEYLAVVHAHPVFATVLSFGEDIIKPADAEGFFYLPAVPVLDVVDTIGSEGAVLKIPPALKKFPACIVRSHGSWVAGKSLSDCYKMTSVLESACKILYYKKILEKIPNGGKI
ncbi:MAG: class II aldolase/adducin family protein [bacterium]